jgi:hypothetical protein
MNLASSVVNLPPDQAISAILRDVQPTPTQTSAQKQPPALREAQAETPNYNKQDVGTETQTELQTRTQLESHLKPGEVLLEYSGGTLPGLFTTKPFGVGLTNHRVILLPLKRGKAAGEAISIWREFLSAVEISGLFSRLKIMVPEGTLAINPNKPYWKKRARQLGAQFRSLPGPKIPEQADPSRIANQAQTFEDLGLIKSALEVIKSADSDQISPEEGELTILQKLKNRQFAYQVTAGFLFANVLMGFFFGLIGMVSGVPVMPSLFFSAVIDILIGVYLWRCQVQPWAGWAILRAAVGAVLYGIIFISQAMYLDLLAQLSFCGAIILALTGTEDRLRTYTSIGIFTIGYFLMIVITFVMGFISAFTG